MDATLSPGFQREFPKVLEKVIEDLGQMLDLEIELDTELFDLKPVQELYAESGDGVVCCRSVFVRAANGVGGMMLPESVADAWSRLAMMMDPAEEGEPFDYDGLVREAMAEIFNIFVGSWNTASPPDYRLGSSTEERAVEHFPTSAPLPEESGVFPFVLRYPVALGDGTESYIGIFLPIKAVHGREVAQFTAPAQFVQTCKVAGAAPAAEATPAPAPTIDPDQPRKPVVFVDYTGEVLPWLRAFAKKPGTKLLFGDHFEPRALEKSKKPAATIIVGLDPEEIGELGASVVEIVQE